MLEHLPSAVAEDAVAVLQHRLGMSRRLSRAVADNVTRVVLYHVGLHEWATGSARVPGGALSRVVGILNGGDPLPERQQAIRTISAELSCSESAAAEQLDLLLSIVLGGVQQLLRDNAHRS